MMKSRDCIILFLGLIGLVGQSLTLQAQVGRQTLQLELGWTDDKPELTLDRSTNDLSVAIYEEERGGYSLDVRMPMSNNSTFTYNIDELAGTAGSRLDIESFRDRIDAVTGTARKRSSALIRIPLEFTEFNRTERLSSIRISIYSRPDRSVNRATSARMTNSVLSSGNWYQFGIPTTGVYKLTYEFLTSLGIQASDLSVSGLSVFGQQGGMLPLRAGDDRTEDLQEIPVRVVASGSTMQPGDYILFYGEGPEQWIFDELKDRFIHDHHLYSDYKGYYITTNAGSGLRVGTFNVPGGGSPTTLNTYDRYAYVEDDVLNLNKSGTDWLGDEFSLTTQRSYAFNFPGVILSEDATLDYRLAARSTSGSSSFDISYNGSVIAGPSIGPVANNYTGNAANPISSGTSFSPASDNLLVAVRYNQSSFSSKGWLDYLAINARCALAVTDEEQFAFRNKDAGSLDRVRYQIARASANLNVWDVTDLFNIGSVNYTLNGSTAAFEAEGNAIHEYVAFTDSDLQPIGIGPIANQNLRGMDDVDYVIITRPALLGAAQDLAAFHEQTSNLRTAVVTVEQIFNEFSSGNTDVTAIRDFLKMLYDRNNDYPAYMCLFGDGTFNNRELGDFFVPTYEGPETLNTLASLVTDDFFGFLDDDEGENVNSNANMLDIAIGRIPADNSNKANIAVAKIKRYYEEAAFGNWRNVGVFVADDEDLNIHIDDAEIIANEFIATNPEMNIEKIYLDAFRQQAGSGGEIYPDVNRSINNRIFKGAMFLNYIGHGGGNGLADERVITLEDIASWDNEYKLPLIISATCEFTRYDDFERYSAGERSFFKEDGGAIALVTTVRLVFSNKNFEMNSSFMNALELGFDDESLTLGDITRIAKNNTATGSGNRKFTLIGDPALRLAFPEVEVRTTAINQSPYSSDVDTLNALTLVEIEGEVFRDGSGVLTNFNGLVYPTVYDKSKTLVTLGNDERSQIIPFDVQNSIIYSGKIQVVNGRFSYSFVVPKDIVYTVGEGKISYYCNDASIDGAGIDTVLVGGGGTLDSNSIDNDGPQVEVFMDDETFISGDFTDESPDMLIKLFDLNGINTVGSGVGHDIVAVIDGDVEAGIVLNDFYESDLNSYQSGRVIYPLEKIPSGVHTVNVKAWDVYNNSGEGYTEFVVAEDAGLALEHVLNYPNPFTTSTKFMFEHNRKGDILDVRIEVFSVSGKLVKTIQETALSSERRVELAWDGLDDYGDRIGKGVYIYRVVLKDSTGEKQEAYQKLVLLR